MSKVILISPNAAASVLSKLYGTQNTKAYNTGSGYPVSSNVNNNSSNQVNAYSNNNSSAQNQVNAPNQNQLNTYSSAQNQVNAPNQLNTYSSAQNQVNAPNQLNTYSSTQNQVNNRFNALSNQNQLNASNQVNNQFNALSNQNQFNALSNQNQFNALSNQNQLNASNQLNAYSNQVNNQLTANQVSNAQANNQLSTAYSLAQINNNPPLVLAVNAQALANPVALPLPTPSGNLTAGQQITERRRPVGTYALSQLHPSIQIPLLSQNTVTSIGAPNVQLPDSFDARTKWPGLITGPLDQQQCGSCWAFSTATSFSDRLRISGKANPDLLSTFTYRVSPTESYTILNNVSAYQLVSCNLCGQNKNDPTLVPICNDGCGGGNLANAFQYLITRGANTFTAINPVPPFPFDNSNPVLFDCQFTNQKPIYKGTNKIMICQPDDSDDVREQKMKHEVYANGPISVAFSVYNSFYTFFQQNPTGIYSAAAQPAGDALAGAHAVVILGWGQQENIKYWIVRNSWSPNWGENGYFKIEINWRPPNNVAPDPNGFPPVLMNEEAWSLV